jgi:hypothetical protein
MVEMKRRVAGWIALVVLGAGFVLLGALTREERVDCMRGR